MKILRLIILLILLKLTAPVYGQERSFWTGNAKSDFHGNEYDYEYSSESSCFALLVLPKKTTIDTSKISPNYSSDGLFLIQNGVYNFTVKGKKYFYYRINEITADSIYISYVFDSTTVIAFSPKQEIKIIFRSLNNGKVGWPHENLANDKYSFSIVKQNKFCSVKSRNICLDSNCSKSVISNYQYMTSGFGWKPIYMEAGNGYLIDNSLQHHLYKPKNK